jgi:hypothetical protein
LVGGESSAFSLEFTEVATSSKPAGDIDSPSAVASEGIPPYRVTFDVSDQEEGEVGDTTSLLGDGQFDPHGIFVVYSAPSFRNADDSVREPDDRSKFHV